MIFVDESIQHPHGFICVAFVYAAEDIAPAVHHSLREAGLEPGVDEYKSGHRMTDRPQLHMLRKGIGRIALGCRLAVYIAPISERPRLLEPTLEIARSIIQANDLPRPQSLFLDEGIGWRHTPLADGTTVAGALAGNDGRRPSGVAWRGKAGFTGYLRHVPTLRRTVVVLINRAGDIGPQGIDERLDLDSRPCKRRTDRLQPHPR